MPLTLARPGQQNLAGDTDANFYDVFAGEVLTAFTQINIMRSLVMVKQVRGGKSTSFPVIGLASAQYHTPGNDITGQNIATGKKTINVDGKLIAPVYIDELDELMNYFDARQPYANALATALSDLFDSHTLIALILGSRASANLTGLPAGTIVTDNAFKLSGDGGGTAASAGAQAEAIYNGIVAAATRLDLNKVPAQGRTCVLPPETYNNLAMARFPSSSFGVVNKDFSNGGSINELYVPPIAGIRVLKSNSVPSTNIEQSGNYTYHYGDFSKTVGVVFHQTAAGVAELLSVTTESEWLIEKQAHLMLAKYATGHDYLRPEAIVELATEAAS